SSRCGARWTPRGCSRTRTRTGCSGACDPEPARASAAYGGADDQEVRMTRAVVAVAYGGAEVLEVADVEVPEPGQGQVLVSMRAAAYNPADWKIYGGLWGTDAAALPRRVGMEGAGVVAAVGEGSRFAVGDEVVVYPANGAFAEQVLAKETALQPKPAGLAWADRKSVV